jgi:hypothetical protein
MTALYISGDLQVLLLICEITLKQPFELMEIKLVSIVFCVAISICGNYGLVGTEAGWLFRYNLQSGFYRGYYSHRNRILSMIVIQLKLRFNTRNFEKNAHNVT